jgi:hypothetical protein
LGRRYKHPSDTRGLPGLRGSGLRDFELLGMLLVHCNGLDECVVGLLISTLLDLQVRLLCVWTSRAQLPDKPVDVPPIAI